MAAGSPARSAREVLNTACLSVKRVMPLKEGEETASPSESRPESPKETTSGRRIATAISKERTVGTLLFVDYSLPFSDQFLEFYLGGQLQDRRGLYGVLEDGRHLHLDHREHPLIERNVPLKVRTQKVIKEYSGFPGFIRPAHDSRAFDLHVALTLGN